MTKTVPECDTWTGKTTSATPACMFRKLAQPTEGALGPFVDKYMEHYRHIHQSVHGAYSYKRELEKLSAFLPDKKPHEVTRQDLMDFILSYTSGMKPTTKKRITQTIKSFFRWLLKVEFIDKDPAVVLDAPSVPKPEPRYLEPGDIRRLEAAMDGDLTMQTYLALGCYAGLRRGSIHSLRWDDIDFEHGTITIRHAKNDKHNVIPLHPQLRRKLLLWRQKTRDSDCPLVMAHKWQGTWRGYGYTQAYRQLKKYVRMAGLPEDTCTHDLRRTFASTMYQEDVDATVISRMLGHANISTTLNHYAFIGDKQKQAAIESLHY